MCFDLLQQSQSYITILSSINSIEQSLPGVIDYLDHKEKGLRALVGGVCIDWRMNRGPVFKWWEIEMTYDQSKKWMDEKIHGRKGWGKSQGIEVWRKKEQRKGGRNSKPWKKIMPKMRDQSQRGKRKKVRKRKKVHFTTFLSVCSSVILYRMWYYPCNSCERSFNAATLHW